MAFTIPFVPRKKVPFPNILCYPNSFMMNLPRKKNRTEAAAGGVGWKKACSFIKKELLSCEFCYILKNTFFTEHLRVTASDHRRCDIKQAENTDAWVSFTKVAGLQDWKFVKKRLQHSCFLVNNAKSLRTPILNNNCERWVLEELGRGYFRSTNKPRLKGDTVAIEEFIRSKWDEMGEKIWKRQKYWKDSVNQI